MTTSDDFLEALRRRGNGRKRIELADVMDCFLSVWPELRSSSSRRDQLAFRIAELRTRGAIVLPKHAMDTSAQPPLPRWISLSANSGMTAPLPTFDHKQHPWAPTVSFLAAWKRIPDPDVALAFHRFFRDSPEMRPMVPIKERSYTIFGDEKKLEAVLNTQYGMHLTLEVLRCFIVPQEPVHRDCSASEARGIVVIENEASFDSLARWNDDYRRWRHVVFGRGDEVLKCAEYLIRAARSECMHYWGDIDDRGISIPWQLARAIAQNGGPSLVPLTRLYVRMLDTTSVSDSDAANSTPMWAEWLPEEIRTRVVRLVASGRRVPQESVGWEWLKNRERSQVLGSDAP